MKSTLPLKNMSGEVITRPKPPIYGVEIDESQEDPELAVIYTDDAINFTPATIDTNGSWGTTGGDNPLFKDIKPCVLQNGVVQYYLDPEDFTKKADGTDAVINGGDGDVMIEIPKMWYRINRSGNKLKVQVSREQFSGARAYAHTREEEGDRDYLYIGAYLGTTISGALRSISGTAEPTGNKTISTFRAEAQANGAGYDQLSFYPLTLLQCLYLIRYKNLNSQTALGRGHVDDDNAYSNTGRSNTAGMYAGQETGNVGDFVKFCGIEDFYGNKNYLIEGMYVDLDRNVFTAFKSFNDTGSGYTNQGQRGTANFNNWLRIPQGDSECGFIGKEVGSPASASTYYCDASRLGADRWPRFGARFSDGDNGGTFFIAIDNTIESSADVRHAARLMYL